MATDMLRDAADDARDALAALDEAEREIPRWRAQLARVATTGLVGDALQARRCAGIVFATIGEARCHTISAVAHADVPADALPA